MVTTHNAGDEFLPVARELLAALAGTEGFLDGQIARSPDEPQTWVFVTNWRDVGSMRRGFGTFDAKVAAAPVMRTAADAASAFEPLVQATPGDLVDRSSDLA